MKNVSIDDENLSWRIFFAILLNLNRDRKWVREGISLAVRLIVGYYDGGRGEKKEHRELM